jgi:hypothetical protein
MFWFVFITHRRGVKYRKKNIKRTHIIHIYDPDKIFLHSNNTIFHLYKGREDSQPQPIYTVV